MFNAGVQRLLEALPGLANLNRSQIRRLLAGAWLDAVRERDFEGDANPQAAADLRRLATAVEVQLYVSNELSSEARRASAFVAAEALGVVREFSPSSDEPQPIAFGSVLRFETVEEALLYLAAGFDANAALTARELDNGSATVEVEICEWATARIRALLEHDRGMPADPAPEAAPEHPVAARVRHEVWRRIGATVEAHVRWLRLLSDEDPDAGSALRSLALDLHDSDRPAASAHPDLHHLCRLLAGACDETGARALRSVPSPLDDGDRFIDYQRNRARRMPLLWPAAAEYSARTLPGPHRHAVVAVPTGAGKSSVAEMATVQALERGWVLYLAPTNALVAQIRRDLAQSLRTLGIQIRGFTGGAEYTQLPGELLGSLTMRQVAVMTPEKCSLALRQNPEAFESLSLCVMDEAHLIGEKSRGVIAELVLAEIIHRSPMVRLLLLSALIDNAEQLARWLTTATGTAAVAIDEPWRPTRTLRALCGVNAERMEVQRELGQASFAALPGHRKNVRVKLPLRLLGALHGTWTGEDLADYEVLETGLDIETLVDRRGVVSRTGYVTPAARALTQALAEAGHRVLTFLPGDRHAPFAYARAMEGPGPGGDTARADIDSLLVLADAELAGIDSGRVSELHAALDRGLAVHTSAMLAEEQRASERAFDRGIATVMFATGTLAQGLNLPATAVVIGGTTVGDAREGRTPEGIARTRAQILNAIGRAGRAQAAARSLAIVVPNRLLPIAVSPNIANARNAAAFLEAEDGSVEVTSRLDGLIAATFSSELDLATMGVSEQTAFAFLSFTAESGDATAVLSRTLAAHNAQAAARAGDVTDALRALGRQFLDREEAGAWIATAAHRAGIDLPAAVALERPLRALLASSPPSDVPGWSLAMVRAVARTPRDVRDSLLRQENFSNTAVAALTSEERAERRTGWRALARTIDAWMAGHPMTEVGAALHGSEEPIGVRRARGDPMPRTLRFVGNTIEHDLTKVAGAIVAIVVTGAESDPQGPWRLEEPAASALARLPVAMRSGAASPAALALVQAGLRPRVVAHLVARLFPEASQQTDEALRSWARQILEDLEDVELVDRHTDNAAEQAVLTAAAYVRLMG